LKALGRTETRYFAGREPARVMKLAAQSSLLLGALIITLLVSQLARSQSPTARSYEVKTAFLFNFAKFIEWPAGSFATPQSPFAICVLGQDPFGTTLTDTLQGKMIGMRPLVVRRLKDKSEARSCQIVFVSSSETPHLAETIETVRGANVLLVGETNGFAASGGTIEFVLENDSVRFAINTDAGDRSGLKFSSKLLALAKLVHDENHSKGG
jgi:hypothetical protein